jgi:divalent metal cation (Fe/Co/Zn/Cd) transporter
VLAAVGLIGVQVTGSTKWDGFSSILIGLMLAYVAFTLGRDNMSLLIGRSVPGSVVDGIREEIQSPGIVEAVGQLAAVQLGPDEVLVAAKVDFVDSASALEVEETCEQIDRNLRKRFSSVKQVFLDPTANISK